MNQQFSSAEELMDHLKKQIIQYSNDDDTIDLTSIKDSSTSHGFDFSRLFIERDSNNTLWNVSTDQPITSHRRKLGRFIVFGKKLVRKLLRWYVSKPFDAQTSFNGSVTRSINEISNILVLFKAKIEANEAVIAEQRSEINSLENKIQLLNEYFITREENDTSELQDFQTISHMFEQINTKINEAESAKDSNSKDMIEKINILNEQIRSFNSRLQQTEQQHKAEISFMQYRLRQFKKVNTINVSEASFEKVITTSIGLPSESEMDSNSFDYLHFENKFRGSLDDIKNRQKVYLPYFLDKHNVLDIGCGRGEFIELLIENNISVKGIDLNQDMIDYCLDRGLPVKYDNAISYLNLIEDNVLGGIFLGQVIEHMPFDQIIVLVELAYKKLKPGSYLIMETPNPMSLAIYYRYFYVDPTHVKPVHPWTIQYIVDSRGFTKTEIKYSSPVESYMTLPRVESDNSIKNLTQFNEGIDRINDLLFGNQDYAIIARK